MLRKTHIERGVFPKKRGLGQFAELRGAWQERGDGVFERGGGEVDTLMHTIGQLGPEDISSYNSRTLASVFTNRTLFSPEL